MPLSQHSDTKQEAEKYRIPRETGFSEALYIQGNQNTSKWKTGILQGHPHLRTGFHRCVLMSWLLVTVAKRYLRAYLRLWFPGRLNLIWLCVRIAFSPLSYAGICAHWIHSISVCGLKRAKKKKKNYFLELDHCRLRHTTVAAQGRETEQAGRAKRWRVSEVWWNHSTCKSWDKLVFSF